ncbi:polysaccharide lyase family 4 protein [Cyathus striatus]|nr:polysaccharide lyase family 4 protein [Cyathus striatus]
MFLKALVSCAWLFNVLVSSASAFGLTESGNSYIVDTSAGLIFTVQKTTGDVTSMKFNGIETQDSGSKKSHISSGIGASCSWVRTGNNNNYIKITCKTSTLTQFYVARYNDPAIHMATYITAEPTIGELRFVARLSKTAVPNGYTDSEIVGGAAVEASDVFKLNGKTKSKFYSAKQFIDDKVHGVTGSGVGVYMIIPGTGYESNSGGPFMRDINNQGSKRLLFNSGHTQTESFRMGLHGPYALWFTSGSTPSSDIDTSFWETLSVTGLVPKASRGRVSGKSSGIASQYSSLQVVGFNNSAAQYWVRTDSSGNFVSPYMKPGTYTMTLYKSELAVSSKSVKVVAGSVTPLNIASQESSPSVIWQIGEFDGTPRGFLNAEHLTSFYPSDNRMKSWGPITFTVGNAISTFPMAIFKAVGSVTIKFTLTSSQVSSSKTLEIGTTLAFAGGRPQVTVNNWTGPAPSAPSQPNSRGVTRGTWRGNWYLQIGSITASSVLLTGTNTLSINVISGSSGVTYLSPNIVFDALRLY